MAKAAKPKKSTKKGVSEKGAITVPGAESIRKLKAPSYKSFKLQRRIKPAAKLPSAFKIFWQAVAILGRNWKVFLGIVIIYGVLNMVLVRGFSGDTNLSTIKDSVDHAVHGNASQLVSGGLLFAYLLGTSGNNASPTAGVFQLVLTLVVSLALIWTLRHAYAKRKVRIRDGFYQGMYPLVPFLLVLAVIGLQLIPLGIGISLYAVIVGNGIAATAAEHILWTLLFFVLALVSLYMIASSIFALYMVTLPDMTPLKALRSARKLVAARRFMVMRKILFLPLALVVLTAVVMVPLIMFVTPVAAWVFIVMGMLLIPIIHSYMYTLYRELL